MKIDLTTFHVFVIVAFIMVILLLFFIAVSNTNDKEGRQKLVASVNAFMDSIKAALLSIVSKQEVHDDRLDRQDEKIKDLKDELIGIKKDVSWLKSSLNKINDYVKVVGIKLGMSTKPKLDISPEEKEAYNENFKEVTKNKKDR